ncbi:(2Fe-2S)-binding protein [bacterium]|nr:(2Fe-2S)-binding protein [bacterium]
MINFFVDGKPVQAPEGSMVIQAAHDAKAAEIPYFCYHPALKPAGLCRMCLVEIEGAPKLQASCTTPISEGMKVITKSARVAQARKDVLEFYLLNHPLDCPICDKAGECMLQDYTFAHARQNSRFRDGEKRRYNYEDLGPKLFRDMDRCVHCLRCVRFCEEIVGDDNLSVFQRGNHTDISIFGSPVVNDFALNIAELCPVGALVSKDFLYQSRVWHLKKTETICTSCATGCNIYMESKDQEVKRITPRINKAVNDHWICDYGRLNYKYVNGDQRVQEAVSRESGEIAVTTPEDLSARIADLLGRTPKDRAGFLITPEATNEEIFEFRRLAEKVVATPNFAYGLVPPEEGKLDFLRNRDKFPNSAGVRRIGASSGLGFNGMKIVEKAESGDLDVLVLFYPHSVIKHPNGAALLTRLAGALSKVKTSVVIDYLKSPASDAATWLIPGLTHAEKNGTMDNAQGMTQKIRRAIFPSPAVIPEKDLLVRISTALSEKGEREKGRKGERESAATT